jgi:putative addiction module killer protein
VSPIVEIECIPWYAHHMKAIKQTSDFAAWMKGLKDRQAVARIRIRLARLAMGNPGQIRNLKSGVTELKIDFGPG